MSPGTGEFTGTVGASSGGIEKQQKQCTFGEFKEVSTNGFHIGQTVKFRDDERHEWQLGMVTSLSPVKVRPDWSDKGFTRGFVEAQGRADLVEVQEEEEEELSPEHARIKSSRGKAAEWLQLEEALVRSREAQLQEEVHLREHSGFGQAAPLGPEGRAFESPPGRRGSTPESDAHSPGRRIQMTPGTGEPACVAEGHATEVVRLKALLRLRETQLRGVIVAARGWRRSCRCGAGGGEELRDAGRRVGEDLRRLRVADLQLSQEDLRASMLERLLRPAAPAAGRGSAEQRAAARTVAQELRQLLPRIDALGLEGEATSPSVLALISAPGEQELPPAAGLGDVRRELLQVECEVKQQQAQLDDVSARKPREPPAPAAPTALQAEDEIAALEKLMDSLVERNEVLERNVRDKQSA